MKETFVKKEELYRNNVALITFRRPDFLLVNLHVWPLDYWKFPQGGVNPGESSEQATKREFREELGSDKIEIIGKSNITRRYRWVKPIVINNVVYVGQDQTFFIVEFMGKNDDILLESGEIRQFRWVKPQSLESFIRRPQLDFESYWITIRGILDEQHSFFALKGINVRS